MKEFEQYLTENLGKIQELPKLHSKWFQEVQFGAAKFPILILQPTEDELACGVKLYIELLYKTYPEFREWLKEKGLCKVSYRFFVKHLFVLFVCR